MERETGAKIAIRGRGSVKEGRAPRPGRDGGSGPGGGGGGGGGGRPDPSDNDDLHVLVMADDDDSLDKVRLGARRMRARAC